VIPLRGILDWILPLASFNTQEIKISKKEEHSPSLCWFLRVVLGFTRPMLACHGRVRMGKVR